MTTTSQPATNKSAKPTDQNDTIERLLAAMSLEEKIGQMSLAQPGEGPPEKTLGPLIRSGKIGAIINVVDPQTIRELQRMASEESPHGIPLLVGRDVIHGFKTVMPIPLGQAATWNPQVIQEGAARAAEEAASVGINWTYAPMMDIARDPRWGRIAESFGEDVYLSCELAAAMVKGFQTGGLDSPTSVAACAKHFVGYGAAESGRDYATTNISEHELHNVYLPPFKAAVEAGVASVMTSFSDLDGIPATAHESLLRGLLREQWSFEGIVVSDWHSIPELCTHGFSGDEADAAIQSVRAGVDLEMASETYNANLPEAVASGAVSEALIDESVRRLLQLKMDLGLFADPYLRSTDQATGPQGEAKETCYQAAVESLVLLKNDNKTLPLSSDRKPKVAVIGPLAEAGYEQLGTWIFDGDPSQSISALAAIRDHLKDGGEVLYDRALETSRSRDSEGIERAGQLASQADVIVLCLGEESILSGEAHSRANIDLPGAQVELVHKMRELGKPVVAVIMAGRPLTLSNVIDQLDAVIYAWHPGTMGGTAIADVLFGQVAPSGKLPVTFPRAVGQIPIYYNAKNTGKPPTPELVTYIDDIPVEAPQTSLGMSAFHLDVDHRPLFVFGHGLSYTEFSYQNMTLSRSVIHPGESIDIRVDLANIGDRDATEIAQLYVRDPVASLTRPVRELKGFQRIQVAAGSTQTIEFRLHTDALKFYKQGQGWIIEPGLFEIWVGGNSNASLHATFEVVDG